MEAGVRSRRAAVCLFAAVSLLGCQSGPKKKVIAVIPKSTAHIFWVTVQAGALAAGEEYGVEVLWNGPPSETDYARQIQIVDSMVARHVDGMAVAANERKALVQPVERAVASGMPVTVFDSGLDSDKPMTFLATNNYEGGMMAARELARLLHGEGTVAVVMHAPGSGSTMDREKGFEDALAKEFPKIKIVATQYGQGERAKALAAAENILSAHPDLGGIFGSSEPSSLGVSLALKARNLGGKVKAVGFDASDNLIEDLRSGVMDALVVQDPFRMGHEAVRTVVEKLTQGKDPPKRMDLSARLVTRADLEKEEIKQLLTPDIKKYIKQ